MSSNNHINDTINLGNYEEFFILYMDHELNEEQVKMVDEFLSKHPDLQAELEILMSTKLPAEEFSMDKSILFADSMKVSSMDEELLLYIDQELEPEKTKIVELELVSNENYRLQHELLLRTKLDASEKITYPDKKELYRRTERVVAFKPWMRIAAAVVVIAAMGVVYFNNASSPETAYPVAVRKTIPFEKKAVEPQPELGAQQPSQNPGINDQHSETNIAASNPVKRNIQKDVKKDAQRILEPINQVNEEVTALNTVEEPRDLLTPPVDRIHADPLPANTSATIDVNKSSKTINSSPVTSLLPDRTIDADGTEATRGDVAKGSVKGFLRKATRLIEKRTGIDPTNDNGELLIGAVAIKLK